MKNDRRSAQDRYREAHAQRRGKAKAAGNAGASTLLPSPNTPMAVTRLFIEQRCRHDGVLTLRHWRGTWWQWRRSHWSEQEKIEVEKLLYEFTEHARCHNAKGEVVPWAPSSKKIGDLLHALAAITLLAPETDQPTWLDGRETGAIVAVANGLLDVNTRELIAHSPQFFNYAAVPFDYDKDAPLPAMVARISPRIMARRLGRRRCAGRVVRLRHQQPARPAENFHHGRPDARGPGRDWAHRDCADRQAECLWPDAKLARRERL